MSLEEREKSLKKPRVKPRNHKKSAVERLKLEEYHRETVERLDK